MRLWVDDIRPAPDSTWVVARTVTEAIRYLWRLDWDEVSLDHDISHYEVLDEADVEQKTYACHECFCAVAYYIAAKPYSDDFRKPKVYLHTANPTGGDEMHSILAGSGIRAEKRYTGRD